VIAGMMIIGPWKTNGDNIKNMKSKRENPFPNDHGHHHQHKKGPSFLKEKKNV